MEIKESYKPNDVRIKSRRLMMRSIAFPMILVLFIAIVGIIFANSAINNQMESAIDGALKAASKGLVDEVTCPTIFEDCEIVYYDINKEYIAGNRDVDLGYDVAYRETIKTKDGVSLKGNVMEMETPGARYYVAVYKDVTGETRLDYIIIIVITILLLLIYLTLMLLSYNLIKKQLSNFEKAMLRNNNLISDISHEFNTPLAIIKTQLAKVMMEPRKKVEDVSDSIAIANNEAGRLNRMVRDMLVLSRSDADRLIITKKKFNLSELIEEIVEPFSMMCQLDKKVLNVYVPKDVIVTSDEDKIKQSLIILLDNAVKYTKPGDSIEVAVKDSYNKIRLTVADTGIGVAKKEIENIFDRFYRTDASRNSETGGSGLGLSIIKAISIALGGKVSARANKPKGFRVDLEFPKK